MKISYNFTEEDYIAFNVFHFQNSQVYQKSKRFFHLFVPIVLLLLALILYFYIGYNLQDLDLIVLIVVSFLWLMLGEEYYDRSLDSNFKAYVDMPGKSTLFGEQELDFQKDYLYMKSDSLEQKIYTDKIHKICCNGDYIFIYVNIVYAIVIRKSEITKEEQEQVLEFFEKKGLMK